MKKLLSALLAFSLLPALAAANEEAADEMPAGQTVQNAIAQARERHAPIFVDFHAVWCHNCYFMQKNVMTGAEWESVEKRAVVIELDGDSPEGSYWFNLWKVGGYPTYVVLDENGGEIGRILGDRPRAQFYKELNPLLDQGAALEKLRAKVTGADAASMAAAREVLRAYYEREDYAGALQWYADLKKKQQLALRTDTRAGLRLKRIELLQAAQQKNPQACLQAAGPVLSGALGCDLLVEMGGLQSCLAALPAEEQKQHLEPYKRQWTQLQRRVLVTGLGECADTRGVVEGASDYYEQIGDTAGFKEVLEQGVNYSQRRLRAKNGVRDAKLDRGLADNLRFYFERLDDVKRLDALYPDLIRAYPNDYVYSFRYGRSLARRGQYAKALPQLEKSSPKSFGRNKLWVDQWRAYSLVKLKRESEAKKLVAETLAANGPWFPKDAAILKAALDGTPPDEQKH